MDVAIVGLLGLVCIVLGNMIAYEMKSKEAIKNALAKASLVAGYTLIVITVLMNFMLVKVLFQNLILDVLLIGAQNAQ